MLPNCQVEMLHSGHCLNQIAARISVRGGVARENYVLACSDFDALGIFFHFAAVFADAAITALTTLKVGDSLE